MDAPVLYADLNLAETQGLRSTSPPPLPQDVCHESGWHRVALKLSCAGLIFLLMGLSVVVGLLVQKSSIEKCSVATQENRTEPTGRPAILECPRDWHLHWDKCLFISQTSRPWAEGLTDCSLRGASLLLIRDGEELRLLQDFSRGKGQQFYIGLKYVQVDKVWKWMNVSILNTNLLKITGKDEENSCALISHTEVFSDSCSSDNHWICQKMLNRV
ncbi:killer cell lectin-like receptor subfamily B member 1 [Apodemus sylvaticus]|uniref:killer cell lectin-like receptor subfamily B member 1 n=1 Tax=Apodemus sylvaticus TaxID=10129 RepID=UPI00224338E6|nr:killer cell lectin-like receptor subfamily B member 1 [Apodemus sylvaticus]